MTDRVSVVTVTADGIGAAVKDFVSREEVLEIRIAGADPVITMRTPGDDMELTAGLLLSEGLVRQREDIVALRPWMGRGDTVQAMVRSLAPATVGDRLARSSLSNSACGVCGKAKLNLEPLRALPPLPDGPRLARETLFTLPETLRAHQDQFQRTGGLHAAALFDATGNLKAVREDVGRHNAVDKLMGWALLNGALPLHEHILMLSGRASFELMHKALMAQVPVVCSISAPSSYAVALAQEFDATLIGFLRGRRFNLYAGLRRLSAPAGADKPGTEITA